MTICRRRQASASPEPGPTRPRFGAYAFALALVVGIAAGCGADSSANPTRAFFPGVPTATPGPVTHEVLVTFRLIDTQYGISGDATFCSGSGPYADVMQGMKAQLRDSNGTAVSFALFDHSTATIAPSTTFNPMSTTLQWGAPITVTECTLTAVLHKVPELPVYTVDMGQRGSVRTTLAQMQQTGWAVEKTIGQ